MGVQNGYNGTRLFLFNGHESIHKEEFMDVEFYRLRYANTSQYYTFISMPCIYFVPYIVTYIF